MLSAFVAVPVGLLILLFAVAVLSMAVACIVFMVVKMVQDIMLKKWSRLVGTLFCLCVAGAFFLLVAFGSFSLGVGVIDGMIERFL